MKNIFAIALLIIAVSLSAAAQDIAAVRRALVSPDGLYVFNVDLTGQMRSDATLQITEIDDSGAFIGYFVRSGEARPSSPNVTDGRIQIIGTFGARAVSILFTPAVPRSKVGGLPLPLGITTYEGAIRLGPGERKAFMAGTYRTGIDNAGPYPFCASLVNLPG